MTQREAKLKAARTATKRTQEIAPCPNTCNRRVRRAAEKSLRVFLETYFAATFYLPWSADHLKVIGRAEQVATSGGLFALAMPRGSGKTSICRAAALWAVLTGRRRFVVLLAASAERANVLLSHLKTTIRFNTLLYRDFARELHGFVALEGQAKRCPGQVFNGKPTSPEWVANRLVFPSIPRSKASGAVISAAGLTGGDVRGQSHVLADGKTVIRPDLVLLDDPQTRDTAASPTQNAERVALVNGDVLGMAGPGKRIAALLALTCIYPFDLASQILDREKSAAWQGERMKLVYKWPDAEAQPLWDRYEQILADSLRADGDGSEATEFYRQHRAEMDHGAAVAWPERFAPNELSALQAAFNLRMHDPATFAAEYQNEPLEDLVRPDVDLTPAMILSKTNGRERREVPQECTTITAFIDVHAGLLYYAVVAWEPGFNGALIDYGTFPRQPRRCSIYKALRPH